MSENRKVQSLSCSKFDGKIWSFSRIFLYSVLASTLVNKVTDAQNELDNKCEDIQDLQREHSTRDSNEAGRPAGRSSSETSSGYYYEYSSDGVSIPPSGLTRT